MVGAICDLVERVWAHGLIQREGKSALWCSLHKHHNGWTEKHPQYSPCKSRSILCYIQTVVSSALSFVISKLLCKDVEHITVL